mmetsp:Transcript_73565/g.204411  ORF Transcript_73565/g.204411 Transcript_73565/m.204411 type:complete len:335 (-) Transcript_73565:532-1536(-)
MSSKPRRSSKLGRASPSNKKRNKMAGNTKESLHWFATANANNTPKMKNLWRKSSPRRPESSFACAVNHCCPVPRWYSKRGRTDLRSSHLRSSAALRDGDANERGHSSERKSTASLSCPLVPVTTLFTSVPSANSKLTQSPGPASPKQRRKAVASASDISDTSCISLARQEVLITAPSEPPSKAGSNTTGRPQRRSASADALAKNSLRGPCPSPPSTVLPLTTLEPVGDSKKGDSTQALSGSCAPASASALSRATTTGAGGTPSGSSRRLSRMPLATHPTRARCSSRRGRPTSASKSHQICKFCAMFSMCAVSSRCMSNTTRSSAGTTYGEGEPS